MHTGQRVGLFDGLSQRDSDENILLATQPDSCSSTEPSHTLPLLIPAKHFAVISAVRSSPPPDLGLPIVSDDVGTAADPDGPPDLEPELDGTANSCSDTATGKVLADAGATVTDHAASLTSIPPPTVSENGVIIIE